MSYGGTSPSYLALKHKPLSVTAVILHGHPLSQEWVQPWEQEFQEGSCILGISGQCLSAKVKREMYQSGRKEGTLTGDMTPGNDLIDRQASPMVETNQSTTDLTLLVVILNYRTPSLTIDCLRSLADDMGVLPQARVVVTDNHSADGSVEQIQTAIATEGWDPWASLMPLPENGGFAYGNNAAIRSYYQEGCLPPYVLLLNPDTVIRPGAFQALVQFMDTHPTVGIAGSRLEDPDGTPQCSAFRFHTVLSEMVAGMRLGLVSRLLRPWVVAPPVSEVACPTDWVAGASMMIRREVIQSVGLMDEAYFMYYEEMDYCLQANRAGWPCWYVPESRVVHLVGQSSGVTDTKRPPKRRPQYWFDSRRRYFIKNYGWLYGAIADTLWALGFASWRTRRVLQRKPDPDPPYLLSDFCLNSVFIRGGTVSPTKCT